MKTIPDENKNYRFLGVDHADRFKTKQIKRVKLLIDIKLNDENLIAAKGFSGSSKFIKGELKQVIRIRIN